MSYRLVDANALAIKYPEVNEMPSIYVDLPNGLDESHYDLTKPCEDAISRKNLIAKIEDIYSGYMLDEGCCPQDFVDIAEELPPVQPKEKVGEWCKQNDDYFDWYECSECGYGSEGEMQYCSEYDVRTNYCPNCGAKMKGSK